MKFVWCEIDEEFTKRASALENVITTFDESRYQKTERNGLDIILNINYHKISGT